jgi:hypothetical protein
MDIEVLEESGISQKQTPAMGAAGGGHVADERLTEVGSVARQGRRLCA